MRSVQDLLSELSAADESLCIKATALINTRETGVVDTTACRDFSGLDTLQASSLLRRLRDRGLLEKQGAGSRTYYTLASPRDELDWNPEQGELPLEGGKRTTSLDWFVQK